MIESKLPTSAARAAEAAAGAGLETSIVEMAETTRTAEEAARACGCEPAQIVKSLIFRGRTTGRPYLLLVSGRNRVDEAKAANRRSEDACVEAGEIVKKVRRLSPDEIRETDRRLEGGGAHPDRRIPRQSALLGRADRQARRHPSRPRRGVACFTNQQSGPSRAKWNARDPSLTTKERHLPHGCAAPYGRRHAPAYT